VTKKRWAEIDVLYTIGTLLVILGHSHSSDWGSFHGTFLDPLLVFIYAFHMPLFFFIAGFLFQNSFALERDGYGKWLGNKALRLLTPYIVLSVAALIPKYYFEHSGFAGFTLHYLLQVLFIPRIGVWGHFWFLPVLLLVYAVFGLWKPLYRGKYTPAVAAMSVVAALTLYFLPFTTQWIGFEDFKTSVIFFLTGVLIRSMSEHFDLTRVSPVSCIAAVACVGMTIIALRRWEGLAAAKLLVAFMMIYFCWELAVFIEDRFVCRWLSKHSFTVYIYSWPFQAMMMTICGRFSFPWYLTTIYMFLTGLCAPILLILLYEKTCKKPHRFLDLVLGVK